MSQTWQEPANPAVTISLQAALRRDRDTAGAAGRDSALSRRSANKRCGAPPDS